MKFIKDFYHNSYYSIKDIRSVEIFVEEIDDKDYFSVIADMPYNVISLSPRFLEKGMAVEYLVKMMQELNGS